jgi:hypothetical protein
VEEWRENSDLWGSLNSSGEKRFMDFSEVGGLGFLEKFRFEGVES